MDNNPSLQFFTFPRDRFLSTQWCVNSGHDNLSECARQSLRRRGALLCEKHFRQSQFMAPKDGNDVNAPKQLLWNAIPTLFPLPLEPEASVGKQSKAAPQEAGSGEERKQENVEDYEMAALPTFGRERLVGIVKKQWHEIKRLRVNVRHLERAVASNHLQDETYILDLLQRHLDGRLLDRVVDIIVGDIE